MLNVFSTNNPNRIAVRTSAFIRKHDPIRRWCFDWHPFQTMPDAPYWWKRFLDDFITAIPRQCYDEGIVQTVRDLREGLYNTVIADALFYLAGELDPFRAEFQHPATTRDEDRQRAEAAYEKHEAERPRKPLAPDVKAALELYATLVMLDDLDPAKAYTIDVLMWKLWQHVPEGERLGLFAEMLESAWCDLPNTVQPEVDTYGAIANHLAGDTAYMDSLIYDLWPNEAKGIECARRQLAAWRKGGADWLADIYQVKVNERAAQLGIAGDDTTYTEFKDAA